MLRFDWCLINSKPSSALQACPRPPLDPQGGSHFPTCRYWPLESCVSLLAGTLRACSAMYSFLKGSFTGPKRYSAGSRVLEDLSLEDTKDSI